MGNQKHSKRSILFIVIMFTLANTTVANDSSLIKLKSKAYFFLKNDKLDSARIYFNKIIIKYPDNPKVVALSYNNIGVIDFKEGFNVRALRYLEKALQVYKSYGNDSLTAKTLYNNGTIYKQLGQYEKANKLLLEATDIFERKQMLIDLSKAYNVIANLNKRTNDFKNALVYHNKSIAVAKSFIDSSLFISYVNNRGTTFLEMEFFDEASYDFQTALKYKLSHKKRKSSAYTYFNLGKTDFLKNNLHFSEQYFKNALQLYREFNIESEMAYTLNYLGYINSKQSNLNAAAEQFFEAENIAIRLEEQDILLENYKFQTEFYEKRRNLEKALNYSKKYNSIYQNILNLEKIETIKELQIKYEVEKKEQENVLLTNQKKMDNFIIEEQNNSISYLKVLILISLLVLLPGSYLTFRIYKVSKREAKLAEKEKQFNLEQHHRIKNHLQTLSSLLSIQINSIQNNVAKEVIRESKNRIDVIKLLHKSFYEEENEINPLVKLDVFLRDIIENLQFIFDMEAVHLELDLVPMLVKPDKTMTLGIIFNEIITNAFKYGLNVQGNSIINVNLRHKNNILILSVSDNGRGIQSDSKPSLGTKLIEQLSKQINAEVELNCKNGTHYKITFKA
jgi:two-component sensor histidine kinase